MWEKERNFSQRKCFFCIKQESRRGGRSGTAQDREAATRPHRGARPPGVRPCDCCAEGTQE